MIEDMQELSMAEVKELVEKVETEKSKAIESYIKRYTKLKPENAKKMRKELESLELIKLKSAHIIKIIDTLPEDASDLNKIFSDVSLDENEIAKILEITKKYK